eukprot:359807-Chlamydomonas_euryale.AAC.1
MVSIAVERHTIDVASHTDHLATPHPNLPQADVVLHMGMHGTVEWLPGAPLGNTGLSWSDVLLGEMPNVCLA